MQKRLLLEQIQNYNGLNQNSNWPLSYAILQRPLKVSLQLKCVRDVALFTLCSVTSRVQPSSMWSKMASGHASPPASRKMGGETMEGTHLSCEGHDMEFGKVHSVPVSLARTQLYGYTDIQDSLGNAVFSWVAWGWTKTTVTIDKGENKYWGHWAGSATSIIPCQKEVTTRLLAPKLFLVLGFSHSLSSQVGPLPSGLHCGPSSLCKAHCMHVKHRKLRPRASPGCMLVWGQNHHGGRLPLCE